MFSPQGESIAYWDPIDASIKRVEVTGGAPVTVCKAAGPFGIGWTGNTIVMKFDAGAADRFGPVANALAKRGEPIGTFDTLMAAHALSLGVTFVTNNTKPFQRVAGLKTVNWA